MTQGFYFLVKFGIWFGSCLYISQKILSDFIEKNISIHHLYFSLEKHIPFQVLKGFSIQNLETTTSLFHSNFFCEIYLSRIINYRGSVFTLPNLRSV